MDEAGQSTFTCDICSADLGMVQSLKRHYKLTHKLKPTEINEKTADMRENKSKCYHCGGLFCRLDMHLKNCPRIVWITEKS